MRSRITNADVSSFCNIHSAGTNFLITVNQAGTPVSDSENSFLMDPADIRCSPAFTRRRFGSFNSNGDVNMNRDDGISPGKFRFRFFDFFS